MQKTKGGKRDRAGRPKLAETAKSRTIRLTDKQWKDFKEIGGLQWLRSKLSDVNRREKS